MRSRSTRGARALAFRSGPAPGLRLAPSPGRGLQLRLAYMVGVFVLAARARAWPRRRPGQGRRPLPALGFAHGANHPWFRGHLARGGEGSLRSRSSFVPGDRFAAGHRSGARPANVRGRGGAPRLVRASAARLACGSQVTPKGLPRRPSLPMLRLSSAIQDLLGGMRRRTMQEFPKGVRSDTEEAAYQGPARTNGHIDLARLAGF